MIDLLSCNLYTLHFDPRIVYDSPNLLFYANREGQGKVTVIGEIFEPQDYGLAFPRGSPPRKKITRIILKLMESDEFERTVKNWLGGISISILRAQKFHQHESAHHELKPS